MAYPATRSMNQDLKEGMTDGKYKKIVQNRGGIVEKDVFYMSREDLNDVFYGIHEDPVKSLQDGRTDRTENFVQNKPAQISV
jgi:hypothetical protein